MLKVNGRQVQEVSNHRRIVLRMALQALAFNKTNAGVDDGFGRETMEIAILEAKDIARQVKCVYLAATVRQQHVAPNRAFNHLIDKVGGLCLSENLGVLAVLKLA
jgi:hypothetical protein